MKWIHLADLHIGKKVNGYDMLEEQKFALDQVVRIAKDEKVDAVLIAGDIYDKSIATKEAVKLYYDFVAKLTLDQNIPVLAISGNHDSKERLEAGNVLSEQVGYHIEGILKPEIKCVILHDTFGEVHFHLLPFADPQEVRLLWPDEEIHDFNDAMSVQIRHIKLNKKVRNVVLSHCYAVTSWNETEEQEDIASQKPLSIGGKEFVLASHFANFDYAALGHLHRAQPIGRESVRYSGSLYKYSFSEETHQKGVLLVELKEKGTPLLVRSIPLEFRRDYYTCRGRFADIIQSAATDPHTDDYVRFVLEDETMVENAMSRLKQFYPQAMELTYAKREYKQRHMRHKEQQSKKSLDELFGDFFEYKWGERISEENAALVHRLIQETGAADETP